MNPQKKNSNKKLSASSNIIGIQRGSSVDTNKNTLKGKNELSFSKLVIQTSKNQNDQNRNLHSEKVHSQSPHKKTELENNFLIPIQDSINKGKKTLILDLDETLIHSGFQPFVNGHDILLKIEIENNVNNIYVLKRPGVDEFLSRMGKIYEIVIFTASMSKYADPLMDILDAKKVCHYRLFRDSCTMVNGFYAKELKRLNRNMKNVILLDNNPASYYLDVENGLPITSFYDDKSDSELFHMAEVLENLAKVNDVRDYIKQIVHMNQVIYETAKRIFFQNELSNSPTKENSRYSEFTVRNENEEKVIINNERITKSANQIKKTIEKNKLKILSVEVVKNIKSEKSKLTPKLENRVNRSLQSSNSIKKSGNSVTNMMTRSNNNFLPNNIRKNMIIPPNYLNTKINSKVSSNLSRPSSVNQTKSNKINLITNENKNTKINLVTIKTINKPLSSPTSNTFSKSTNKELERKNSSNSTSKNLIKLKNVNKSINKFTNKTNSLREVSDLQKSLEFNFDGTFKPTKGNNTTRSTKIVLSKNNLVLLKNNNKSLSPFKNNQLVESKEKNNPSSARNYGDYMNFRKDKNERPASKEKFSSLITNKKEYKTNPLSDSQNSTSLSFNKFKSSGKINSQSDLKIVKVITNKSLSKSKNVGERKY